jgi:hypothetical protein
LQRATCSSWSSHCARGGSRLRERFSSSRRQWAVGGRAETRSHWAGGRCPPPGTLTGLRIGPERCRGNAGCPATPPADRPRSRRTQGRRRTRASSRARSR